MNFRLDHSGSQLASSVLADQLSSTLKGLHVIATARRSELLRELADIYGMSILPLDITNTDSIEACHAEVAQITGGKLDFLVNNA